MVEQDVPEVRGSNSSGGLLLLVLLIGIGIYLYPQVFSAASSSGVAPLCSKVADLYTQHTYALEACQDALANSIPGSLFVRQMYQESGLNPDVGVSATGDVGIAQFQPATAQGLGIDPNDPHAALRGAAQLMGRYYQEYDQDYSKALGAYNAGSGALASAVQRCGSAWKSCLPESTQQYIAIIVQA